MTVDPQKRPFGDGSKFGSAQIVDVTKFQNSPKIVIRACHPCMRDSTCTFEKYGCTSQKYDFAHIVLRARVRELDVVVEGHWGRGLGEPADAAAEPSEQYSGVVSTGTSRLRYGTGTSK